MIKTVKTLPELQAACAQLAEPVGLVPTMGYLHEGHLSLVRRARLECQSIVASIFVNPAQFGPTEDLDVYPRNISEDLRLLDSVGCDLAWIPTSEIIYPPGYQTWISVNQVSLPLEGEHRPGHFRGVATVVAKLFNAVQPQKAYFGQKDAQQAVVIQKMTLDLNFPIMVVICPTVRESDGLAMSSRNTYLDSAQRQAATVLYRALCAARDAVENGERAVPLLKQLVMDILMCEPLAALQYIAVSNPETLEDLDIVEQDALFSMAVYVGNTRLIDNFLLQGGQWQIGVKG